MAQIALAWLQNQPGVTSVILGANKMSQLEDNLGATEVELSADELERLSGTTEPSKLYPQWIVEFQSVDR